jgi:hypothetical protein
LGTVFSACTRVIDSTAVRGPDGRSPDSAADSNKDGKMASRARAFSLVVNGVRHLKTITEPVCA